MPHLPGRAASAPWKPLEKAEQEWDLKRRKKIRRRLFLFLYFANPTRDVGRGGVTITDTETKAVKTNASSTFRRNEYGAVAPPPERPSQTLNREAEGSRRVDESFLRNWGRRRKFRDGMGRGTHCFALCRYL